MTVEGEPSSMQGCENERRKKSDHGYDGIDRTYHSNPVPNDSESTRPPHPANASPNACQILLQILFDGFSVAMGLHGWQALPASVVEVIFRAVDTD